MSVFCAFCTLVVFSLAYLLYSVESPEFFYSSGQKDKLKVCLGKIMDKNGCSEPEKLDEIVKRLDYNY
jgi:hypothetical protein